MDVQMRLVHDVNDADVSWWFDGGDLFIILFYLNLSFLISSNW